MCKKCSKLCKYEQKGQNCTKREKKHEKNVKKSQKLTPLGKISTDLFPFLLPGSQIVASEEEKVCIVS